MADLVTKNTAMDIALAYREIETAEEILSSIQNALKDRQQPDIRDAFGRPQPGLQLGVPSGQSGTRLYNVPYALAVPVIEAHIAHHRAKIGALSHKALAELGQTVAA